MLLFCDTYDIAVRTCISELLQFTLLLSFLPLNTWNHFLNLLWMDVPNGWIKWTLGYIMNWTAKANPETPALHHPTFLATIFLFKLQEKVHYFRGSAILLEHTMPPITTPRYFNCLTQNGNFSRICIHVLVILSRYFRNVICSRYLYQKEIPQYQQLYLCPLYCGIMSPKWPFFNCFILTRN